MTGNPQTLDMLDRLLDLIDECPSPHEAELAHEHVQEARTYFLGAMPEEFSLNLGLARESLARMPESEPRRAAEGLLAKVTQVGAI